MLKFCLNFFIYNNFYHSLNDKKKKEKIFTTNNSLSENSYNRLTLSESFTCVSVLNVLPSIDVTVCNDKEKDYISYLCYFFINYTIYILIYIFVLIKKCS